jgi:hypothetical protein
VGCADQGREFELTQSCPLFCHFLQFPLNFSVESRCSLNLKESHAITFSINFCCCQGFESKCVAMTASSLLSLSRPQSVSSLGNHPIRSSILCGCTSARPSPPGRRADDSVFTIYTSGKKHTEPSRNIWPWFSSTRHRW